MLCSLRKHMQMTNDLQLFDNSQATRQDQQIHKGTESSTDNNGNVSRKQTDYCFVTFVMLETVRNSGWVHVFCVL